MSYKYCFPLLVLILFAILPLGAANVSIMVFETGLDMEGDANLHSGLWESGLLDVFFDSGHVVSNAPIMRLDYMPDEVFPAQAQDSLNEAREGGMEYILSAQLNYANYTSKRPANVIVRLFRIQPFKMIFEETFSDSKSKTSREEFEFVKQAARKFPPRIK